MKKKSSYNVAVVGAKGAVGSEMIKILEERKFPVADLRLFGSARSKGTSARFQGRDVPVRELKFEPDEFQGIDIVLSSPGALVSTKFVPHAIKTGAVVIDNTSAFRMHPKVPLVIPEINPEDIKKHKGIIANPNCSAIIMLMAVAPLHRKNPIKRILCSTYQSASGAGAKAMRELETQTRDVLDGKPIKKEVFPHQIAFNLFSHNSTIEENGYNEEELKMIQEAHKILHDDSIRIATTCVRVPVFRAHSEAIYIEFERKMPLEQAHNILSKAPGIKLVDDQKSNHFPMPIEASGGNDVLVGRLRVDLSCKNGLVLFVSGDQLRKGAALNAIQIAEKLIQKN
ncbi:MAG: aspartate-semialdehyde dehydrogenase [Omnitrophica bacterium RIFCSPHIGHO2_02_FULL_46_11]|nr:MAG: aspartate-semialdehyde dehydrogenase [Omnitrophica bacterium RIFCSPHIGHO2_02_FULL_46_11]OGW87586.1 MAG: aspartate-semialdehyde dehydrogenase [Omnitrophica bacterium RIFCSPLOWO2_01_FULL_45_10b]